MKWALAGAMLTAIAGCALDESGGVTAVEGVASTSGELRAKPGAGARVYNAQFHACAILERGAVKCWGQNGGGALGLGDTSWRGDAAGEMGDNLPFVSLGTGRTAVELALGNASTCALLDNGQVKCWGVNFYGQLGKGDLLDRGDGPSEMGDFLAPVPLGSGRTAKALTAGAAHVCALLDNNQVKCWGYNAYGQLGLGDTNNRGDAAAEMGDSLGVVPLGTGRTAKAVSAGAVHTCALLDNNTAKCWGYNAYGQLGQGSVASLGDQPNELGNALPAINLGTGRTVKSLTGGYVSTCAILDNNALKCWGYNAQGQLGYGDTNSRGDGAGEMGDALLAVNLGTGRTATSVVQPGSTCALLDNATVKCWGDNSAGQLGLGDTNARGDQAGEMGNSLPALDFGGGTTIRSLSAGNAALFHCAITSLGFVRCWGTNAGGELGLGDTNLRGDNPGELALTPNLDLGAKRGAQSVVAGGRHTCALMTNNRVKCWGDNTQGQLGLGNTSLHGGFILSMGDSLPTVELGTGRTVKQLASQANAFHTCALLDNNSVKCWGGNSFGSLGLGDTNIHGDNAAEMGDSLAAVSLGTGRTAKAVATGMDFSCAILDNNTLKCWGSNVYGTLGQGSTVPRGNLPNQLGDTLPPINLGTGRTAKAVAAGAYHVCAILDNNTVKCWGRGEHGQLGLGDTAVRGDQPNEMGDTLPVVSFGTGRTAKAIAAAELATCVLMDNNQVKCWGDNGFGTLGYGDMIRRGDQAGEMGDTLPTVNVGTARSVKAISAGDGVVCALRDDNSLACWGANIQGSLGINMSTPRGDHPNEMGDFLIPVILNNPDAALAPSADPALLPFVASAHSCAVLASGLLKCWGENMFGQLGLMDILPRGFFSPQMESLPFVDLGTDTASPL